MSDRVSGTGSNSNNDTSLVHAAARSISGPIVAPPAAAPPAVLTTTHLQAVGFQLDVNAILREREALLFERNALREENEHFRERIEELQSDMAYVNREKLQALEAVQANYSAQLEDAKKENKNLQEEIAVLRKENFMLREKIAGLEAALLQQQKTVEELQVSVAKLQTAVEVLNARDKPITVREIMRKLEAHVCLELAGSKTRARSGLFNFSKFRDKGRGGEVIEAVGSVSVADLIDRLKDAGDYAAHGQRPRIHIDELRIILVEDDDGEEEVAAKERVLVLLRTYELIDEEGFIVLKDAF